jgi:putative oxidoreductase
MMNRLYTYTDSRGSIALLLLRLVVGVAFVLHGLPKIQNPFGWAKDGFPPFLQALAALSEFGGGLALIVGLLTPLAMFGLLCTMLVAAWTHASQGAPWVGAGGPSYELAALYAVIALAFVLIGPGRFSLDALLFGKKTSQSPVGVGRLVRQSQE